jgi:ABC-type Mn2+/Zn2+ transport system permease subunit
MHSLLEPWTHGFVQRAFVELALLGLVGAVLGCWVVLYELSYSAESLAHALFPGLVAAALLGWPMLGGGLAGAFVAAVAIALAAGTPAIGRDTAVAVVITSLFGLGALLGLAPASPPGLQSLLFGDVLGVTPTDLGIAAAFAGVALVSLTAAHRSLLAVGFDRSAARSLGASAPIADVIVLALVAGTVVVGVQALGNLLVVAVIVGPAAAARLVTSRMLPMMCVATAMAVVASAAGLYASYYLETAGGASVALAIVAVYAVVAVLLSPTASRTLRRVSRDERRFDDD